MKFITIFFMLFPAFVQSQTAYKIGELVPDLRIGKILNYNASSFSLKNLQANITIIDFFGTWCAPCIKALPELAACKTKFKEDISILLVSTEAETKLSKFISSRQPFAFPLIVDEDNLFTNAFAPPSYPYTIVLDKNLKILSITNAADLSETILRKFVEDGKKVMESKPDKSFPEVVKKASTASKAYTGSSNYLAKLSQDFMYAAKTNEPTNSYIKELQDLNYSELLRGLKNDDEKKAFWINLYNAYTNTALRTYPDQYKRRNKFFRNKNIVVAGKNFSLDKIEHGILRRGSIKWSLGYLSKLFPGKIETELRVDTLDYRIHFALNCGAKSCPPIAFYDPENLNAQLDVATTAYLTSEINYDSETNKLKLPAILGWFRRDFGGKKNMIELLKTKQLLTSTVDPKVRFKKYDWSLYLDNYK